MDAEVTKVKICPLLFCHQILRKFSKGKTKRHLGIAHVVQSVWQGMNGAWNRKPLLTALT